MNVLLVAGLGPEYKSGQHLQGTFFDPLTAQRLARDYLPWAGDNFSLTRFVRPMDEKLLRPLQGAMPHLTTAVLQSILYRSGYDPITLRLEDLWAGRVHPGRQSFDAVLLSTTFICNRFHLARTIGLLSQSICWKHLILGGQYANLKFSEIMQHCPEVDFVVRGDAEEALPLLLSALKHGTVARVPNLVFRGQSGIITTAVASVDIDGLSAPDFEQAWEYIPYESMRGCPFRCKFCSYPAASPQWRYKSAEQIARDWARYSERNGCRHIKAMDSTFTVPPVRFKRLLSLLPRVPVTWEAYCRADTINDRETVQALEEAHCRELSLGLESMSDRTLGYMRKQVHAEANRLAVELLWTSNLYHRCSFMIGFPGETPDDYQLTHTYLEREFKGWCMLSVFAFTDETMPLWDDKERFSLEFDDRDNPAYTWRHTGMSASYAFELFATTMTQMRRANDDAVMVLWQPPFVRPLCPEQDKRVNLRVEKLIERLAFLPIDHPNLAEGRAIGERYREELAALGIRYPGEPD